MKKFFRYLTPLLLILVVGITAAWAGDRINSDRQILPENLSHVSFAGADGSSCEKAVVIRNAANNGEGVAAEKAWVTWKYPNAKLKGQAVSGAGNSERCRQQNLRYVGNRNRRWGAQDGLFRYHRFFWTVVRVKAIAAPVNVS